MTVWTGDKTEDLAFDSSSALSDVFGLGLGIKNVQPQSIAYLWILVHVVKCLWEVWIARTAAYRSPITDGHGMDFFAMPCRPRANIAEMAK